MPKTKACINCEQVFELTTGFYKRKTSKDGHRNSCKQCDKNRVKNWTLENKEKRQEYCRNYHQDNKDYLCAKSRQWRTDNLEKARQTDRIKHSKRCKKKEAERFKKYRKDNPEKVNARSSIYRRRKQKSELYFLYKIDIYEIYKNCPKDHEVDHIVPISNKMVSGLHVPWNLQYLSKMDNKSKGNRFDGTNKNESWRVDA